MTTAPGELLAGMVLVTAQFERRLISQRTREALAQKKAAGVRLGRPSSLPAEVVDWTVTAQAAGQSLRAIAAALNADGVLTPTVGPNGGTRRWPPYCMLRVLPRPKSRDDREGGSATSGRAVMPRRS